MNSNLRIPNLKKITNFPKVAEILANSINQKTYQYTANLPVDPETFTIVNGKVIERKRIIVWFTKYSTFVHNRVSLYEEILNWLNSDCGKWTAEHGEFLNFSYLEDQLGMDFYIMVTAFLPIGRATEFYLKFGKPSID